MEKVERVISKMPIFSSISKPPLNSSEKQRSRNEIITFKADDDDDDDENSSSRSGGRWYNIFRKKKKNLGVCNAEIRKRMHGISVYTVSDHSECPWSLITQNKDVEFFFFTKSDAKDCLQHVAATSNNTLNLRPLDLPLCNMLPRGSLDPVRLVPELSQVKNAQQIRKDIAHDTPFSGVPVFLTDLKFEFKPSTGYIGEFKPNTNYHPMFLRKEDLEKTLLSDPNFKKDKYNIKVAGLEDIVKSMKDCSTSKWNDAVFIAPGYTLMSWIRRNDLLYNMG